MHNGKPAVGLSLMLQDAFWLAAGPLFDSGCVQVVEWSFDMAWGRVLPKRLLYALREFSDRDQLLGHGVSYSVLDASETDRQEQWLRQLQIELNRWNYRQLSEHFGFMGGGNFHRASPLPVPRTATSLRVGRERLQRLAETARRPVGLENLAFAFGLDDVRRQGEFLEDLLEPTDGFLLLDLHNIYCQSCNFDIDAMTLLEGYPLHRVRELHLSGGSWSETSGQRVRRDTHDDRVPDELFAILPDVLSRCPQVQAVILERMDGTLNSEHPHELEAFRADFLRLRQICVETN